MKRTYDLVGGKVVEASAGSGPILFFVAPDEAEKRCLLEEYKLDEHTLASALDPNELPRLEFEPDHAAIVLNRPRKYRAEDTLFFRVASTGVFLFADRLIVVMEEDVDLFGQTKFFQRIKSLREVFLRIIYRTVFHFLDHLAVINAVSDELEDKVNTSLQNDYLIQLFNLEKSLVYLVSAIRYNGALLERIRHNAPKLGLTSEELELLDDIVIENNECTKQAEIHSNVVAGLMDARVSIVNNNLSHLIKRLNFVMIALMWPTLACGVFSMNVKLPMEQETTWLPFWLIICIAFGPVAVAYLLYLRRGKL